MSNFVIEEEHGTTYASHHPLHRHDGYFAGTFTGPAQPADLTRWFSWGRTESTRSAA